MNTEAESMNLPATVTIANQAEADARIPAALANGPVHLRIEGMEGKIDLTYLSVTPYEWMDCLGGLHVHTSALFQRKCPAVLSVTVSGGERPLHPSWVRDLRDQCKAAGVPFRFESWGDWVHLSQSAECRAARDAGHNPGFWNFQCDRCLRQIAENRIDWTGRDCTCISVYRFGRERSGCTLDGVIHDGETERMVER